MRFGNRHSFDLIDSGGNTTSSIAVAFSSSMVGMDLILESVTPEH